MIHKLIVSKLITDNDIKKLKGTWIDEEYIKHPIINTDTDIYYIMKIMKKNYYLNLEKMLSQKNCVS